jgi:endonuclease/exonuclease/phosphatase family metal-dependent hydrolase
MYANAIDTRRPPAPRRSFLPRRTWLASLVAVSLTAACTDAPGAFGPEGASDPALDAMPAQGRAFTVYSQNLYLGGDTGPLLSLDFDNVPAVVEATNRFWNQVTTSDAEARIEAVVARISAHRPHLVGLQEAFRFAVVDLSTGTPTVTGSVDLLTIMENAIARLELPYEVVAVQENTTTGPAGGLPLAIDPGAGRVTRILQFTDRIAVLRRTDVPVETVEQDGFEAAFDLGPLTLERGWIRVRTNIDGVPWHFVTTHLEVQELAPVQAAQADELIRGVTAGLDGLTILAGDLNSDAANPGAPSWTPTYDKLIEAGFTDAWEQSGQPASEPGYTCCQSPDLRNETSSLAERIDFVLQRGAGNPSRSGFVPGSVSVEIVVDDPTDRIGGGLWPSDHAGIVASVRAAPGLFAHP